MTYPLPLKILGVGRYLPDRIVPSSELERSAGLEAGWIERKQGVKERRRVALETNSEMAAAAAHEALDDAGLQPADLDLILSFGHRGAGYPGRRSAHPASSRSRRIGHRMPQRSYNLPELPDGIRP
jgi:hypothetical protein